MSGVTEYNKEEPQSGLVTSVLVVVADLNTTGDSSAHKRRRTAVRQRPVSHVQKSHWNRVAESC
jgi:hypothetical protein